jgi:DNA modification methylase
MGSGTTAKGAILLNRNWIGSELNDEYVEIIKKRLEIV